MVLALYLEDRKQGEKHDRPRRCDARYMHFISSVGGDVETSIDLTTGAPVLMKMQAGFAPSLLPSNVRRPLVSVAGRRESSAPRQLPQQVFGAVIHPLINRAL
jgi:hypothetical protein